jgi:hypothetical protein
MSREGKERMAVLMVSGLAVGEIALNIDKTRQKQLSGRIGNPRSKH